MRRTHLLPVATVAAWFALGGLALAAPSVIASDPEEGAELHEAPGEVSITFDLPLDPGESDLVVVDECGREVDDSNVSVAGNQMSVGIAKTPAGRYSMVYRAVPPAGATGSSSGKVEFTVLHGPSCGPGAAMHEHGDHEDTGPGDGHTEGHGDDQSGDGTHDHDATEHGSDHHAGSSDAGHGTHGEHVPGAPGDHADHKEREGGRGNHAGHKQAGDRGPQRQRPSVAALQAEDFTSSVEPGALIAALLLCALLGLAGGYLGLVRNHS